MTRKIIPIFLFCAVLAAAFLVLRDQGLDPVSAVKGYVEPAVTRYCTFEQTIEDEAGEGEIDLYDCGKHGQKAWSVTEGNWL